jgi:restriction endonuclease Mrr
MGRDGWATRRSGVCRQFRRLSRSKRCFDYYLGILQRRKEYVDRIEKKIVLIDGEQLAQYMIDYGIGVAEVATYTVKKADLDYFGEDQ